MKKSAFIGVSNLKRTLLFLSAVLVVMTFSGVAHTGDVYITLDVPGANGTYAYGIDGNNIVGTWYNGPPHGFLYDGTTYTTLDAPEANDYTEVWGIDGNNIVGWYWDGSVDHGFLYDISTKTYTPLDVPGSCNTYAYGIDGNNIVGTYKKVDVPNDYYVFLYDITTLTYTTLPNSPVSYYPGVVDIDGNNIVGCYSDSSGYHGFLYDISTKTYTTLDYPRSGYTHAYGIDGNNIVGCYWDDGDSTYRVFLYDITTPTYTTLNLPASAWYAEVVRIDGNNIVGWYSDGNGDHGFVTSTPSPQEALGEIVNTVLVLNLHAGISNSLDSKLQNAISALDDMNENNDVAAINSLNAFINAVEAQRGNKITVEDADALIAETNAIIALLEAQ